MTSATGVREGRPGTLKPAGPDESTRIVVPLGGAGHDPALPTGRGEGRWGAGGGSWKWRKDCGCTLPVSALAETPVSTRRGVGAVGGAWNNEYDTCRGAAHRGARRGAAHFQRTRSMELEYSGPTATRHGDGPVGEPRCRRGSTTSRRSSPPFGRWSS